jgi:uncharacterized protein (TIGR02001 family)
MRVLAWLLATACAAHAGEATEAASATPDQFKLLIGSVLMSDYIFRGISYSAHQPAVGTYFDAQQGWLYVYSNFNSVRFSTNPAGELTMAVGARPTLGPFEFDIGAEYYYYPGEIGPEHSNYWEGHATVSHKLTDKITWGSTLAYAPNVWQTGAKRHLTGENECNGTGEEAQYHQRTAHQFERSGKAIERKQRHILERRHGRKFQQLRHSILQEQQTRHDTQQAQDARLPG